MVALLYNMNCREICCRPTDRKEVIFQKFSEILPTLPRRIIIHGKFMVYLWAFMLKEHQGSLEISIANADIQCGRVLGRAERQIRPNVLKAFTF